MTEKNNEKNDLRIGKPKAPFSNDPFNNRGGKGGKKGAAVVASKGAKTAKINVPKFKGGSGGDR